MSDDEDPKLTLAASNDEREMAKRALLDDIYWPTKELTANLLRVARGAGKPEKLIQQIAHLAWTITEAGEVSNAWEIWSEMEQALQSILLDKPTYRDLDHARNAIVSGALQVAASRLVGQYPIECQGQREMDQGMQAIEVIREANRQKWAASVQPVRKPRMPKPKPSKPTARTKKA